MMIQDDIGQYPEFDCYETLSSTEPKIIVIQDRQIPMNTESYNKSPNEKVCIKKIFRKALEETTQDDIHDAEQNRQNNKDKNDKKR